MSRGKKDILKQLWERMEKTAKHDNPKAIIKDPYFKSEVYKKKWGFIKR